VLVHAGCLIGPSAAAEFHLALVEVLFELVPFLGGRGVVLLGRAAVTAALEEGLVVAYQVFVEHRHVAAGCFQVEVAQ
jgi:hypothetical protein